ILSDPIFGDMISWEESGSRFVISNPKEFASQVLPKYYETSKFASFSRQLNIYNFYRISDRRRTKQYSENSSIVYSHPHFQRAKPELLHHIHRK
ncbi:winged helix DNA-binding domain-containing protein, partial [Basidiobolus meristosporus CBS 931.73]